MGPTALDEIDPGLSEVCGKVDRRDARNTQQISDPRPRERDPNTMRRGGRTKLRLVPLASLRSARSLAGLGRLFEIAWQELPKWDCAGEAHFNPAK
jgi:hypothetical protein